MAPVAMPIIRPAVVGVGTRAVIGGRPVISVIAGTVVAVARPVIIGAVGAGDAGSSAQEVGPQRLISARCSCARYSRKDASRSAW